MRALFAISILALLALLWASISIARHVRRARRRRRETGRHAGVISFANPAPAEDIDGQPAAPSVPFANPSKVERIDWAYFNKDLGDLSDPYQERRTKPRTPSAR